MSVTPFFEALSAVGQEFFMVPEIALKPLIGRRVKLAKIITVFMADLRTG
jgi:hypothetical protein